MGDTMKSIKDQRGFTIIELITSFSLTMVVLVFLFNIVVIMKETYIVNSTKSDLVVMQSLLSTALNEDLYNNMTRFYKGTSTSSFNAEGYDVGYRVYFNDGTNALLKISTTNNKLQYKGIEYTADSLLVTGYTICKGEYSGTTDDLDSYLKITINMSSSVLKDETFDINVIQLYDTSKVNTVNGNGVDIPNCTI